MGVWLSFGLQALAFGYERPNAAPLKYVPRDPDYIRAHRVYETILRRVEIGPTSAVHHLGGGPPPGHYRDADLAIHLL